MTPFSAGPCLIVVVAGEADSATAASLRDELVGALAYGPRSVVLDLTELGFCSVQGLRALIEAVDIAERAGAVVTMRGISRQLSWLHETFLVRRRTVAQRADLRSRSREPRSPFRAVSGISRV